MDSLLLARARRRWTLAVTAALLSACATTKVAVKPSGDWSTFKQTGEASWYGPTFHGKTTANGERYNMLRLTAAHKQLPFNTLVRVTNLANGKSATVRINDRGPFLKGRILDLSYGAAQALGANGPGVIRVRIEVVGKAAPTAATAKKPSATSAPAAP
jgi:rare lipoprotein A